ncbi:MAG: matrixin family metalloprotease [Candidatus Caenarcaniphilales bacterium]|nr:matrixin family metalloprotease [Candidatus Caenarcaniphilales bacterium]
MRIILAVLIMVVVCLGALFIIKLNEFSENIQHTGNISSAPRLISPSLSNPVISINTVLVNGSSESMAAPVIEVDQNRYPNFVSDLIQKDGKVYRWHKFNLTYYIDPATRHRLNEAKVMRAFNQWQQKSRLFSFQSTSDPGIADITISLASTSEKERMGEAGPDKIVLGQIYQIGEQKINEFEIKHAQVILSSEHFGFDRVQAYDKAGKDHGFQTLVHELGHVLGITGHSSNQEDCMYFQAHHTAKACNNITPDANTLLMIYGRTDLLSRDLYKSDL